MKLHIAQKKKKYKPVIFNSDISNIRENYLSNFYHLLSQIL